MRVRQPQISKEIVSSLIKWKKELAVNGHSAWVKVPDVRKMGRRHVHRCVRQNRITHLLSDGEYRAYQVLVWRPNVLAVYEQVPIHLPLSLSVASDLNIVHHRNYKTNEAYVVTTDFVVKEVDVKTGEIISTAYSFKYWDQYYVIDNDGRVSLKKGRTLQKLKIERECWRRKNTKYKLISELDATKAKCWNLDWFSQEWGIQIDRAIKVKFSELFLESWYGQPLSLIQDHIDFACKKLSYSKCQGVTLFKLAALEQILPIDLSEKLKLYYPVKLLDQEGN